MLLANLIKGLISYHEESTKLQDTADELFEEIERGHELVEELSKKDDEESKKRKESIEQAHKDLLELLEY